jgi:hypothetical protein
MKPSPMSGYFNWSLDGTPEVSQQISILAGKGKNALALSRQLGMSKSPLGHAAQIARIDGSISRVSAVENTHHSGP